MSKPIIDVERLSKCYRIGAMREPYLSLRDELAKKTRRISSGFSRLFSKDRIQPSSDETDFWALNDVSFSVQEGEAVGIIGRNGAGKSTLLKILSQITPPTKGQITMRGRVASLLEVGTGFHPELTGRENIFLNGAILGMRREEIRRKFDEIVAFAEVDKFLDTPVKRYSSGMYVRLAFAVAAHLEPEILVVDEVLAVGDAQFQKKCLGKMGEVANAGRTVLFVSHNMQAIVTLCKRAILLQGGQKFLDGTPETITSRYLVNQDANCSEINWLEDEKSPGDEMLQLRSVRLADINGNIMGVIPSGQQFRIHIEFDLFSLHPALTIGFDLMSAGGAVVFRSYHNDPPEYKWPELVIGRNCLECDVPEGFLNAGRYGIAIRASLHCVRWIIHEEPCLWFDVNLTHGVSPFWTVLRAGNRPGLIAPILPWRATSGNKLPHNSIG